MATSTNKLFLDSSYSLHYPEGMTHLDGAPAEVLAMAHPHWHTFAPIHPMIQHFLGVLFFTLWVISCVGNGLVMFMFLRVKSLRTPSNMFVVTLAFSDFFMMMTMAPPVFVNMFISRWWAYGEPMCNLYGFLGGVFGVWSLALIIVIGYDRYNVIVKGLGGTKVTAKLAALLILLSFLFTMAITLPPFVRVWGAYTVEGMMLTCSFDYADNSLHNRSYMLYICVCGYLLPLCFVLYYYSQIVVAVVSHERALRAQAKKMNVDSLRSNQDSSAESAEVRAAKVAVTNVTVWFLAWTPYTAISLFAVFGGLPYVTPLMSQLPSFAAKTASMFNPLIYAISHPKFREAMSVHMPCFGIREGPGAKADRDDGCNKTMTTST